MGTVDRPPLNPYGFDETSETVEAILDLADHGEFTLALDIATGSGATALAVSRIAVRVIATAHSPALVLAAAQSIDARRARNVVACLADPERLPLAASSVDLITCRSTGRELASVRRALEESVRVLRTDAVFILAHTERLDDAWLAHREPVAESALPCPTVSWCRLLEEYRLTIDAVVTTRGEAPTPEAAGEVEPRPDVASCPELRPSLPVVRQVCAVPRDRVLAAHAWRHALIRARRV
jgi:SAM-dependent methyltransferase